MKNSETFKHGKFLSSAILSAAILFPAALHAQTQDLWLGGTGDFEVATNWNLGVVPISGYAANNDTGSNNVSIISATDTNLTFNGFRDGISASGAFLQQGATITLGATQGGWLRMGVNAGSLGVYTIESNAVLNTTANGITVGEVGSGILNIYGGAINVGGATVSVNGGSISSAGAPAAGSYGIINQTNGIISGTGQVWIGQNPNGQNGVYNLSGGIAAFTNWFVMGRSGGTGVMNMTGGNLYAGGNGGNLDVGTGNGTGTLNQSGGTITIVGGGQFLCPQVAGGPGFYNLSGTGALVCNNWLAIGRGGPGTLTMSGGTIIKTDTGSDHIDLGAGGASGSLGYGTVNQTGGVVTNTTTDVWLGEVANSTWTFSGGTNYFGNLIICEGSGLNCTFTLSGGFLSVGTISSAQPVSSHSTLNLNGGTIQASGSSTGFIRNLSSVSLQPGGVTFDTQGYNETISDSLSDGGGGALVKVGSGALTLSAANSYAGATMVSNGILSTTTASTGGGSYSTSDGTTLDVGVTSAGSSLSAANMTLGSTNGATVQIDLGSTGNPSVAPIAVGGTLTLNGTITINVTDSTPATGQFQLISYGSLAGTGTVQLGTLSPGMQGVIVNDVASNSIDLDVTSAGAPAWNGTVNGNWDVGITTNWLDLATAAPETFHNGEPVVFNDNATGTTTINVATTVQPGSVTVDNNSLTYTFTGSGAIAGATGLVKEGTSTLALTMAGNTYTGPTMIEQGDLNVTSLANGGSPSGIGESSSNPTNLVLAGGTLSYTGPAVSINRGYMDTDTNAAIDIDAEANLNLSGAVLAGIGSGFNKGGPAQLAYTDAGINILSDVLGYTVDEGPVLLSGPAGGQTNIMVGTLTIGTNASTNASLSVSTNSTLNLTTGSDVIVANGNNGNSVGALNVSGGTANFFSGYQVWVGQGAGAVGALNVTAGTLNVSNWLAVGRDNGTGTMSVSGGTVLINNAGAFDIGTSAGINGQVGTGTLTQTGGLISNNCPTWLGEGASGEPASGTWTMSGGTAILEGNVGQNSPSSLVVGQSGTGTNTLNLYGTGSISCANYVSLGQSAGTTGILNIGNVAQPGGTFTLSTGQDFDVGNNGDGTLNMIAGGGGQLSTAGTMYLTRGGSASGTVNLDGGILAVGYLNNGYGFGSDTTNNAQVFNFNGGTLRANTGSPYFIQPYVNTVVQSGGAMIDDGGYTITAESVLADGGGGGGLVKLGAGTLYLTAAETYTGMTIVSNGALGIGPAGSIAGPVTVEPGATLRGDIGSVQTAYIYNSLTLNAGSTTAMQLTPSSNDEIAGLTSVTYGGALVITNTGGALTAGHVYQLFNSAAPGSGNFSSVTVWPSGTATFNPANGTLTIGAAIPPTFGTTVLSNGNVIITGSGGTPGAGYTLLDTTNLLTPLADWVTNTTGTFSSSGTFTNTIAATNAQAMFFDLRSP